MSRQEITSRPSGPRSTREVRKQVCVRLEAALCRPIGVCRGTQVQSPRGLHLITLNVKGHKSKFASSDFKALFSDLEFFLRVKSLFCYIDAKTFLSKYISQMYLENKCYFFIILTRLYQYLIF